MSETEGVRGGGPGSQTGAGWWEFQVQSCYRFAAKCVSLRVPQLPIGYGCGLHLAALVARSQASVMDGTHMGMDTWQRVNIWHTAGVQAVLVDGFRLNTIVAHFPRHLGPPPSAPWIMLST